MWKSIIIIYGGLGAFLAWVIAAQFAPVIHFLPYAFTLGAVLGIFGFITFQSVASRTQDLTRTGPLPSTSSLCLSHPHHFGVEQERLWRRQSYQQLKIKHLAPEVSQQLDHVIALVIRDNVWSWLQRVTSNVSFSNEIDRTIRIAIANIVLTFHQQDMVHILVTRALPIINNHLASFTLAESLVLGQRDLRQRRQSGAVKLSEVEVAAKFNSGKLHPAASLASSKTSIPQQRHLRDLVERFMPKIVPLAIIKSPSVRVVVRELMTCAVICPLMQLMCDPDFLLQQVEIQGRSLLRDPITNVKGRQVPPSARSQSLGVSANRASEKGHRHLQPGNTEAQYNDFLRYIQSCNSLLEVQHMQDMIARQFRDDTALFATDGLHLRRLENVRRMLEQRVSQLTNKQSEGVGAPKKPSSAWIEPDQGVDESSSLRDTLYDVAGLSYFMEFMDRFDLAVYVQFWITVDGILASLGPPQSQSDSASSRMPQKACSEGDRKMIERIYEKFLIQPAIENILLYPQAIHNFLREGDAATASHYDAACRALSRAQGQVFQEMEAQYFPAFQNSDLYQQWTGRGSAHPTKNDTLSQGIQHSRSLSRPRNDHVREKSTFTPSGGAGQTPSLRRTAASSSDLVHDLQKSTLFQGTRRSLDENSRRMPLFDNDSEQESDSKSETDFVFNSISALDQDGNRSSEDEPNQQLERKSGSKTGKLQSPLRKNLVQTSSSETDLRAISERKYTETQRPSLNSLGLLGTPSKRTVFLTDDLFGERETLWEDDDSHVDVSDREDEVREASTGDLGLLEVVQSLNVDIEKLEAQQNVLRSLVSKAELTNNAAELKILRKSVADLERDLHRKELQRQQYIVQERDNSLYGKASVAVGSVRVGTESDGREYALYEVRIQRRGSQETPSASWSVTKRYSEFHELHRRLRHRFPYIRELPFPKRQVVSTLQNDFVQRRRMALEHYLRLILDESRICQSIELRAFLSEQPVRGPRNQQPSVEANKRDLISRIYASLSEGLEDFVGNTPVLDQLSIAGQNLISAATAANLTTLTTSFLGQSEETSQPVAPQAVATNPATAAEAQAEISAFDSTSTTHAAPNDPFTVTPAKRLHTTSFISPIAESFITLFQLNSGNNWLRGRAVVIVLQQILGGTVERRIRDTFHNLTTPASVSCYISNLREIIWPNDIRRSPSEVRSNTEKARTRRDAETILTALLVENAGSVVGRGAIREAAKRVVRCLGNERLNLHLLFTLVDELVPALLDGDRGE